jgi:hypothetical protein
LHKYITTDGEVRLILNTWLTLPNYERVKQSLQSARDGFSLQGWLTTCAIARSSTTLAPVNREWIAINGN